MLSVLPHNRRDPWRQNDLAARYLMHALGVTREAPPDQAFMAAYHPGRRDSSAFADDARQTPLALAFALSLIAQDRNEDADAVLDGDAMTLTPPEPEPLDDPDEELEDGAEPVEEVIHEEPEVESDLDIDPPDMTPLPDDFPMRAELVQSGFDTMEGVMRASDQALLEINGVGDAKLSLIRAALDSG